MKIASRVRFNVRSGDHVAPVWVAINQRHDVEPALSATAAEWIVQDAWDLAYSSGQIPGRLCRRRIAVEADLGTARWHGSVWRGRVTLTGQENLYDLLDRLEQFHRDAVRAASLGSFIATVCPEENP